MGRTPTYGASVRKRARELFGKGWGWRKVQAQMRAEMGDDAPGKTWLEKERRAFLAQGVASPPAAPPRPPASRPANDPPDLDDPDDDPEADSILDDLNATISDIEAQARTAMGEHGSPAMFASITRLRLQAIGIKARISPPAAPDINAIPDVADAARRCREALHELVDRAWDEEEKPR